MKEAELFWNDIKNIEWFRKQPVSLYWFDFFKEIKGAEKLRILDLGCGGGRNSEMIYKLKFDFYACDNYVGMVNETKERLSSLGLDRDVIDTRISLCQMDKLPYESSFFDYIISHGVYHNAFNEDEYVEAIKESSRVLKKGGILCYNIFTSKDLCQDMKLAKVNDTLYTTIDSLPMVLFSKKQFLKIAKKSNLYPLSIPVEYMSTVTTGTRSVMRGFLIKK